MKSYSFDLVFPHLKFEKTQDLILECGFLRLERLMKDSTIEIHPLGFEDLDLNFIEKVRKVYQQNNLVDPLQQISQLRVLYDLLGNCLLSESYSHNSSRFFNNKTHFLYSDNYFEVAGKSIDLGNKMGTIFENYIFPSDSSSCYRYSRIVPPTRVLRDVEHLDFTFY